MFELSFIVKIKALYIFNKKVPYNKGLNFEIFEKTDCEKRKIKRKKLCC